jgi:hypothetical protein
MIKSGLINLIKIGNIFTTEKGLAYLNVARDSWHLNPILKYLQNLQNILFPISGLAKSLR